MMRKLFAVVALFGAVSADQVLTQASDTSQEVGKYTKTLKTKTDLTFTIVQLNDLMIDGTSESYLETQSLIENVIYNLKPDLIVLTGDTVDPSKSEDYGKLYESAMQFIIEQNIPWVWTGGSQIRNLTRDKLLALDKQLNFVNSWSGYKWNLYSSSNNLSEQ